MIKLDDKKKKGLKITAVIVLSMVLIHYSLTLYFALSNFAYNSQIVIDEKVIEEQHFKPYGDFKYGGLGNVDDNGCGAVAVYNILKMTGKDVKFADVVKYFDVAGNFAYGKLGTRPSKMISYLRERGFEVGYAFLEENFDQIAKKSKFSIYVYIGKFSDGNWGGHYHLLTSYSSKTGKYKSINPSGYVSFSQLFDMTNQCFFKMLIYVN